LSPPPPGSSESHRLPLPRGRSSESHRLPRRGSSVSHLLRGGSEGCPRTAPSSAGLDRLFVSGDSFLGDLLGGFFFFGEREREEEEERDEYDDRLERLERLERLMLLLWLRLERDVLWLGLRRTRLLST